MSPRRSLITRSLLTALPFLALLPASAQKPTPAPEIATLRQNFLKPPNDARPMMRWWWFGTAVEKPEILRELQQMKANGIGGAELAFVYPQVLDDPAKGLVNHPFLSPEMLDAVRYAQTEARKLGLRIDVTLCSGWPYGGPATTLAEAATRLRTVEIPLSADATTLPQVKLADGESIISVSIVDGEPKHWNAASAHVVQPNAPIPSGAGPHVALFFIQSHTRQQVKRAAVGAEGYVLDPFSHDAVATHLKAVGEPLVGAFGTTPPYAIFSDSLEAYGADWTPNLPAEFQKRRGYDLIPHLPELVAGGTPEAEQVRHDWGQTLTELVNQNYLTQINNWAIEHHTKFRSQTYGEPAVSFSSQNLVALAEGEGPQWRAFSTLRWATSANHVFGHNVTSGETFTWLHSPVFRATPLDMKAEADIDFIMGENQIIGHGWPYSAPQVGEPGWSLYAAGAFNNHNPWHPVMPEVTHYIQRISYLMRQGEPANQVAILLPTDDAWAGFLPGHVTVTGAMQKLISPELMSAILSAGYNIDFIDADAINKVGLGAHQILVIPPTDRIPVETLKKIADWRKQQYGISQGRQYDVVCYQRCPSIDADGKPLPGMTGSFLVAKDLKDLTGDLTSAATPDLRLDHVSDTDRDALGFIRRKLPNADVYFLTNTSNHEVSAGVSFATKFKHRVRLDPDTGREVPELAPTQSAPTAESSVTLAPYESAVFLLADNVTSPHVPEKNDTQPLTDLSSNWSVRFTGIDHIQNEPTLTDWIADPATKNYSGEAVYTRSFTLASTPKTPTFLQVDGGNPTADAPNRPAEHVLGPNGLPDPRITRPGPGMRAYYDPPIREAAIVYINGQRAGALWHPPYRLDVTKLLKPGENHIEIRVYNTAINAWAAQPPHDYKPLIAKYGDRFQMQDLDKVKPVPSGILGQIHLVTGDTR
jgi:hypothetical protein